jgi:hypothetical protein
MPLAWQWHDSIAGVYIYGLVESGQPDIAQVLHHRFVDGALCCSWAGDAGESAAQGAHAVFVKADNDILQPAALCRRQ